MRVKVNWVSIFAKIAGIFIMLGALFMKIFGMTNIDMIEVVQIVLSLQAMVLPIDLSKIISTFSKIKNV